MTIPTYHFNHTLQALKQSDNINNILHSAINSNTVDYDSMFLGAFSAKWRKIQ